ncbi:hypothetical protein [Arthrobacter sp. YN]
MRVKELAVKYGISRETVSKHLRREPSHYATLAWMWPG